MASSECPYDLATTPQLNPHWYTGPTQCPHRAAGCPWYGPFPDVIKYPSMLTPKRAGNAKERAGKKGDDKDEPVGKKAKENPGTQKKLSFGAGGLQLTS